MTRTLNIFGFQTLGLLCLLLLGAIGGAGAQYPGGITTAPQFWFKADAITGTTDGTAITTLADSSGNGHTATPTTTGPVYHASGINGKPYLTFSSSPLTTNTFFDSTYNSSLDYFYVLTDAAAGSGSPAVVISSASNTFFAGWTPNSTRTSNIQYGSGTTLGFSLPTALSVSSGRYDGANESIYWNTHPIFGKSVATAPSLSGVLTLGGGAGGGFSYNGNVYEVLVYKGISAADHAAVAQYLMTKYGFTDLPANGTLVIAHGNSLTSGVNSTGGNDYVTQMAAQLGGTNVVINYGVGGQTLAQMSAQLPYIDGLSAIPGKKVYLCWEGTNSIVQNVSASTAYSQFTALCTARRAEGYKVIAMSTITNGVFTTAQEATRQTYNASIRSGWNTFSDSFIDMGSDPIVGLPGLSSNTTYFAADTTHLTNLGYSIVAQQATTAVRVVTTLNNSNLSLSSQIKRGR